MEKCIIEFLCPNCGKKIRQVAGEQELSCCYCPTDFSRVFLEKNEMRAAINAANSGEINPETFYCGGERREFNKERERLAEIQKQISVLKRKETVLRATVALSALHLRYPDRKGFTEKEVSAETVSILRRCQRNSAAEPVKARQRS